MSVQPVNFTNYYQKYPYIQPQKMAFVNKDIKKENHLSSKAKIAIGITALSVIALTAYALLRRGRGVSSVRNAANNLRREASHNIRPPKISDIPPNPDLVRNCTRFPLEVEYARIMTDIERHPGTLNRYNEVISGLQDTARQIGNKVRAICPGETFTVDRRQLDRTIRQKRYFSLPGNARPGYCCKDPLLHKEAREEAMDIIFGYRLLSPLNTESESKLLNALRSRYRSIPVRDNNFITECIERLRPEDAVCYGHESKFHAHELSRLGKIFREAMGIQVS